MTTILIIEDERELVKILTSYLENAGHSVLSATRGDTGYSLWQQKKPDLVLLDLNLPGMDGLDVAREIRRQSETPIIMLTARVEEIDKLIGLELGADDYITKALLTAGSGSPYQNRTAQGRQRTGLQQGNQSRGPGH